MHDVTDSIDSTALAALQADGRASWADLGTALGLSAPAAAERVRKLADNGTIRGFTAVLDPGAAGFPVLAFVAVTLASQGARTGFLNAVRRHDLIQECHHVAGDDDFLLKVRARSLAELEAVLADELKGRLGIARTRTTIVLGTAKETTRLPVAATAPGLAPTRGKATRASRRAARPKR
jgi:Lrp/AsnC family leucine-responsive transcriptional regulator